MITLTLDTSLAACSAGIVEDGRICVQAQELRARGHAERLIPMVQEILQKAGHPKISRIVTTVGPGSFTGLRVALSAAQAFGLAWQCTVHAVSTLDAVAFAARNCDGRKILVAHDAGRGQCYGQLFDADAIALSALRADSADAMIDWARSENARLIGGGTAQGDAAVDPWPAPLAMMGLVDAGRELSSLTPIYGTGWTAAPV